MSKIKNATAELNIIFQNSCSNRTGNELARYRINEGSVPKRMTKRPGVLFQGKIFTFVNNGFPETILIKR